MRSSIADPFIKAAWLLALLLPASAWAQSRCTVYPDRPRQVIKGIGFEIQSDSIGSGNQGLPPEPVGVPHDLLPSERDRLASEMLKGFRYCRLAGGLYWRGLDTEQRTLCPRWPQQLQELHQLLDAAGVEGVSLEYWSPAPYWKANRSFVALPGSNGRAMNELRCFAPGFENDPDYHGDTDRFLTDFAAAVVEDIKTLKSAGIKTSLFGLQNEPNVNHSIYSSCEYRTSQDYVKAYRAVAGAVRAYDPAIVLFADTEEGFPRKIGPAMTDPQVAALVDAYAVHIVGSPSSTPAQVDAQIKAKLPARPWFQNEYEYLTGGATPERCLNTVEHIMNSFQLAGNPTWFWIHCLKPLKNAEASGYALGFWRSLIEPSGGTPAEQFRRWPDGPEFTHLPDVLKKFEMISAKVSGTDPAISFDFIVNQPVTVYLLAQAYDGLTLDSGWQKTDLTTDWKGGSDVIYKRQYPMGPINIPASGGTVAGRPTAPHLVFVEASDPSTLQIRIGINVPIEIRSEALALQRKAASIQPECWIFNPYNWHAVGSFVKHMPWDSTALEISETAPDPHGRLFAFRKPNGKLTIVIANGSKTPRSFEIATGLSGSAWRGFLYTPDEAGKDCLGIPLGERSGAILNQSLTPLSWEFWEQE
jgi:hypothetical protein